VKALRKEADERLLVEAAQADPARFVELYEGNFDRVYAFIVTRVRSRQDAEDLTSEVFRSALEKLPKFEWRGVPLAAWLLRIAANAIADRWKRVAREGGNLAREPPDAEIAAQIERRTMLLQLVDKLPPDQRRVIVARFIEQKSIREIATEFDRTDGAIKHLQLRALKNLRLRIHAKSAERRVHA
jgi:RNA polymerase sigma-70 factor (ECF subfamily)